MKAEQIQVYALAGGLVLVGLFAMKLMRPGGVAEVATGVGQAVGSGAVNVVGGVTTGVVGGISQGIGVPTPWDTTTDERVARWLIDTQGYWTAAMWCGAPALFRASMMDEGTGVPPSPGTPVYDKFVKPNTGGATGSW